MAWIITRDGRTTYGRYATDLEALGELHKRVGYSADHAVTHEGYAFLEVPDDKWSDLEAREMHNQAVRMFQDHGHGGDWSALTRENCGACCLEGYPTRETRTTGPNYTGWERAYIQAGHTIKKAWRPAFEAALHDENEVYARALALDVATFGIVAGWEA